MRSSGEDWPLWMKLAWQVLAVGLLVLRGPEFMDSLAPERAGVDFLQEWSSVQNWKHGRPIYSYMPDTLPADLPEILAGKKVYFGIEYNAHPPFSVLLTLPLAAELRYQHALLAWNLLSLALLAVSLAIMALELNFRLNRWLWLPALALLLVYNPLRQQVNQGQLNAVLLLFLTLAWQADRHGRAAWAGAWVGLATATKLFPGLFLFYFALRRQWRACWVLLLTAGAAHALVLVVLGPQCFWDYARVVVPYVENFRAARLNASIPGFFIKLFEGSVKENVEPLLASPLARQAGTWLAAACVLAILASFTARPRPGWSVDRLYSLWLVAMLLLSPITWDHSLLLATLPLLWLWQARPQDWLARANVLVIVALFSINHQGEWLLRIKEGTLPLPFGTLEVVTAASVLLYTLLILFAWLCLIRPSAGEPTS